MIECAGTNVVRVPTKPDRLARSTAELLSILADQSKRGIDPVVLSMGGERLDTRNPTSKLMLAILAGVATWRGRSCWSDRARASPRQRPPANTKVDPPASTRRQIRQLRAELEPTAIAKRLKP